MASIDLSIGGLVQTAYSYDGATGLFTLTKRDDPVTINRTEQGQLNIAIRTWYDIVWTYCTGFIASDVPYKWQVDDDGLVRTFLLRIGAVPDDKKAVRAVWDRSNVLVLYEQRPKLELSAPAFQRFMSMLDKIHEEMMAV